MSQPAHDPLRLLLVEDDPVYERILRAHIRRLGDRVGEVVHVSRIEDGLQRHKAQPADLVLLDLTLPDSPPEATLGRVREFVEGGAAVLVLSALDDPESSSRARAAGALGFLDKGKVSVEQLSEALDRAVDPCPPAPAEAPLAASDAPPATAPPATGPPASEPPVEQSLDHPQRLAAQLVHDARSWITNHSFRLAALKRTAGPEAEQLIEGLSDTTRALVELLDAGRALVIDETTPVALEPVDLRPWVARWAEQRAASPGGARIHASIPGTTLAVTGCLAGLEVVMGTVIENAEQASPDRPVNVDLQATSAAEGCVEVDLADHGGSWGVDDPQQLIGAFQKGDRGSTRAGLGLYRARRWMERMGGSLELIPRHDTPGAMTVRLRFKGA